MVIDSRIVRFVAVAGGFLPWPAYAHGGISSIGALLPIFIAMWTLAAVLFVWSIFSLVMFFSSPPSVTGRMLGLYKKISIVLVSFVSLASLLGSTLFSPVLLIAFFIVLAIVGPLAMYIFNRAANRTQPEIE